MYRFLDRLTPDQVEAIAALAFRWRCWRRASRAVAEFHYLHHQPGGAPYADPAEMSRADRRGRGRDRASASRCCRCSTATAARDGGRSAGGQRAVRQRPRTASLRLLDGARGRRWLACPRRAARRRAAFAARDGARTTSRRCSRRMRGRPAPHARGRAAARGRGGRAPGSARGPSSGCSTTLGVDAALVPDPLHPDDRDETARPRRARARSPGSARSPRRTSATASSTGVRWLAAGGRLRDRHRTPTSASRSPRSCGRSNTPSGCATSRGTCWRRRGRRSGRTLCEGAARGGARALGRGTRARSRWGARGPRGDRRRGAGALRAARATQLLDGVVFAARGRGW